MEMTSFPQSAQKAAPSQAAQVNVTANVRSLASETVGKDSSR